MAERTAFWNGLTAELPAFVDYLLQWEIPVDLQSERFGITHYHHPHIVRALDDLCPEKRMLTLIDGELFNDGVTAKWQGTAEELEKSLTDRDASTSYAARQLLTFNTAAGVYLGRLAKKHPDRVSERRVHGRREWTINRELVAGWQGISILTNKVKDEEGTLAKQRAISTNHETPSHPATALKPAELSLNHQLEAVTDDTLHV